MGINHQRKFEGLTSVRIFAYIETDKARLWNMVTFFSSCSIPGGSESTERFLRHWGAGAATHWSKWTEIWVQTWGKILVSFGKRPLDSWVFSNMFRQSNIWTAINWVVGLYGIYSRGELVSRQTNPPDRHEVLSAAMLFLSHAVTWCHWYFTCEGGWNFCKTEQHLHEKRPWNGAQQSSSAKRCRWAQWHRETLICLRPGWWSLTQFAAVCQAAPKSKGRVMHFASAWHCFS